MSNIPSGSAAYIIGEQRSRGLNHSSNALASFMSGRNMASGLSFGEDWYNDINSLLSYGHKQCQGNNCQPRLSGSSELWTLRASYRKQRKNMVSLHYESGSSWTSSLGYRHYQQQRVNYSANRIRQTTIGQWCGSQQKLLPISGCTR